MFEECAYVSQSLTLRRFDILRENASTGKLTPIQALRDYDQPLNRIIALAKQQKIPRNFVIPGMISRKILKKRSVGVMEYWNNGVLE